jgi:hypothetical protein
LTTRAALDDVAARSAISNGERERVRWMTARSRAPMLIDNRIAPRGGMQKLTKTWCLRTGVTRYIFCGIFRDFPKFSDLANAFLYANAVRADSAAIAQGYQRDAGRRRADNSDVS